MTSWTLITWRFRWRNRKAESFRLLVSAHAGSRAGLMLSSSASSAVFRMGRGGESCLGFAQLAQEGQAGGLEALTLGRPPIHLPHPPSLVGETQTELPWFPSPTSNSEDSTGAGRARAKGEQLQICSCSKLQFSPWDPTANVCWAPGITLTHSASCKVLC